MLSSLLAAGLEAVRATVLPCSFLLVAPAALAVLSAGASRVAVATTGLVAVGGGWLAVSADGLAGDGVTRVLAVAVLAAVGLAVHATVAERGPKPPIPVVHGMLAAVASAAGTLWWRPCVGPELGRILNGSATDPTGQLPAMAAYMVGAMVPVMGLAFALRALDLGPERRRWVQGGAVATLAVLAVTVAAGHHEAVAGTLARWSL